jgi:hypothetical protein
MILRGCAADSWGAILAGIAQPIAALAASSIRQEMELGKGRISKVASTAQAATASGLGQEPVTARS